MRRVHRGAIAVERNGRPSPRPRGLCHWGQLTLSILCPQVHVDDACAYHPASDPFRLFRDLSSCLSLAAFTATALAMTSLNSHTTERRFTLPRIDALAQNDHVRDPIAGDSSQSLSNLTNTSPKRVSSMRLRSCVRSASEYVLTHLGVVVVGPARRPPDAISLAEAC